MTRAEVQSATAKIASLKTIEGLLDYAILESADVGLPLIVCLLRMARFELETALASSLLDRDAFEISPQ